MKCEDCKFWINDENCLDDDVQALPNVKRCSKVVEIWEASEWQIKGHKWPDRVMKPEFKDQKSFVMDGSSYMAYLYTRNDFFCAHFEEA